MKKLFLSALSVLLLGSGWANAGGIEVDFTQRDVLKKNLPLQLRGKAVLSAKGLTTAGTVTSSDAVTSRKILKESVFDLRHIVSKQKIGICCINGILD